MASARPFLTWRRLLTYTPRHHSATPHPGLLEQGRACHAAVEAVDDELDMVAAHLHRHSGPGQRYRRRVATVDTPGMGQQLRELREIMDREVEVVA